MISAPAVSALFRRNGWREWFTPKDTRDLLHHALFVASAWQGRRAAGIATLFGDGRYYARLDTLLVDEPFWRQGIRTRPVQIVMQEVEQLKPHYCEHDTHEDWLVKFYERFGFRVSEGPWLVHRPTEARLVAYVGKRRATLTRR